jgi:hypothetical protein
MAEHPEGVADISPVRYQMSRPREFLTPDDGIRPRANKKQITTGHKTVALYPRP